MDFGFAPDGDEIIKNMRSMFERRASTTLINEKKAPGVSTVRQFITHLETNNGITKPVGDLLLGAHANNEGEFQLPMFPKQVGWTNYETLEESLKDAAKSINVDTVIGFKAGDPITHSVHIKGCNLGQALPFVTKLKEALGGHVTLTVPKLFHGTTPWPAEGVIEYIGYQFAMSRTQIFASRKAAIAEWDNAGFTLIDGNPVTTADWQALIPADPNTSVWKNVNSKLGTAFGKRTTIRTPRQHRIVPITFGPWTVPIPPGKPVPADKSGQLQALESHLQTKPLFKDTHPYPQFKREGFDRVIEFVSGYDWNCVPVKRTLVCNGRRLLYMVVVAITDPTTVPQGKLIGDGNLIFNFYPNAKSKFPVSTSAIQVTNKKFFVTV
jgi:hypothetical protein